jgi:flagellar biosynthesis protein FlhG
MGKPKIWCITSGKGGVGKTSLAVNLAFALGQKSLRVLLVDGDLGLANVDVLLGLQVACTIREILDEGADSRGAVVEVHPGVLVLPASSGVPDLANLGPEEQEQLREVLEGLAQGVDIVLVDTAAGIGPGVLWFNRWADASLVVVTPDPTALTDAYALIKVMSQQHDRREFSLVLNQVQDDNEAQQTFATLSRVAAKFLNVHLRQEGAVPLDPAVRQAVRAQAPFLLQAPHCRASLAVKALATQLYRTLNSR